VISRVAKVDWFTSRIFQRPAAGFVLGLMRQQSDSPERNALLAVEFLISDHRDLPTLHWSHREATIVDIDIFLCSSRMGAVIIAVSAKMALLRTSQAAGPIFHGPLGGAVCVWVDVVV